MARPARRRLTAELLEARITPALSPTGPYSPDDAVAAAAAGTALYRLHAASPAADAPEITLTSFLPVSIRVDALRRHLAAAPAESPEVMDAGGVVAAFPQPGGGFARFRVWQVEMMEPGLAAVMPTVRTWRGQGIDDPAAVLAADVTDHGFHAQVLSPHGHWYIDPYSKSEPGLYVSYTREQVQNPHGGGCGCLLCQGAITGDVAGKPPGGEQKPPLGEGTGEGEGGETGERPSNGQTLRIYRTAVAATGEYTAFHGGTQALGQAAIVTAVNRVSGVYETELSARLVLVANNINLVYTNASTDPYTNNNGSTMLGQNQTNVDAVIGNANYDLGHVFSTGGGGVAFLGVVGNSANKARGVTGSGSPVGDAFWIDYVAHEMGHQFGGNHTFNGNNSNRVASAAYEPGSASTIMGYAGIMGSDNLQLNSDAYFHAKSLDEITNVIDVTGSPGGSTQTATGNAIPVADAGPDYTIPANTPFALTGSATDGNAGDVLTYNWEQYDLGPQSALGTPDNGTIPLFRSWTATTNPTRYFPRLPNLLANTSSTSEVMPTTSRNLNFKLTVRDNRVTGAYDFDDMVVTTVATGAAFAVTAPNTAVTWNAGTVQAVTWNVAGTTGNGINAALVDVLLSTDGGLTFPHLLAAATPNDGVAGVTVPNLPTSTARIKVQPVGNIFFDVGNANFTIAAAAPMQVTASAPPIGGLVAGAAGTLDLTFSNPVNAATVATTDLVLSRGSVTGASVVGGGNVVRFNLDGLTTEGPLTATLAAGAIADTGGNNSIAFTGIYDVDITTLPLPVAFAPSGPVGSLAYSATTGATVQAADDTDSFTVTLDAGQTLAAVVTPGAALRPTVTVTGPGGTNSTASGGAAGTVALLAPVPVTAAGTYTVTVGSLDGTAGGYTLRLMLNTAGESEASGGAANNTIATAQALASLVLPGGATLRSVTGAFDPLVGNLPTEVEANDTTATANSGSLNFLPVTSNLYQLNVSGTASTSGDLDWFNIGALQAGDVISITGSGTGGLRGTNPDVLVRLYNSAGAAVAENDDDGPGNDAIVYRFTVTAASTYSIRVSFFSTGSYHLSVLLENATTAPSTGGTVSTETENNGTQATGNDVSTSWQQISYLSTTTGTVSTTGDPDYFALPLALGDLVTFTATSTSALDARLTIRNSAGTVIAQEDGTSAGPGGSSPVYAFRPTATGTYFAQVHSASGTGTYTLTAARSTTATVPLPPPPPDFYAIPLAVGETVRVGLDTGSGTPALELQNAAGGVVATAAAAGAYEQALTYTPTSAGTYYARVLSSAPVPYTLVATTGAALDIESNDTFATAQPIGRGSDDVLGALSGNDDWFSIDVSQNDQVTLSVDVPGGGPGEFANGLAPRHEVYTPGNVLLTSSEGGTINFTAAASGAYRVRVMPSMAVSPPTAGEYVLRRTTVDPAPAVVNTVVDIGTDQRSRVASLRVNFSEPVSPVGTVGQAFSLAGPAGAVSLSVVLDPSRLFATITFPSGTTGGSLDDGNYTLTVVADQLIDDGGNLLGGSTFAFYRLYGDANGDRAVNGGDLFFFRPTLGSAAGDPTYVPYFDYQADGFINGADLFQFRTRFGQTLNP